MARDPIKQSICAKRHYEKHMVAMKARAIAWKQENGHLCKKYVYNYLIEHPCVDCGESDPVVLEFDHKDRSQKRFDVSLASSGSYGLESVKIEIQKCEIRCANCHRKKTYRESGWTHRG